MIQTSPETSPLFHVETPNTVTSIIDTEYVSILNSPCERDKKASLIISYHTMVVNHYPQNSSPCYHTHNPNTKIRISHSIQNQFSGLNVKKENKTNKLEFKNQISDIKSQKINKHFQISDSKIKIDLTPTSPQQLALSLPGPTVIS